MIVAIVLLVFSLLPLTEEAYPPVILTMMFMLWHVLINSEDIASDPSSYTLMNAILLS